MTDEKQVTTAQDLEDLIKLMMDQEGYKRLPPAFATIFYLGIIIGSFEDKTRKLEPKELSMLRVVTRFGVDKRPYSRNPMPIGEKRMQNVVKKVLTQLDAQKNNT